MIRLIADASAIGAYLLPDELGPDADFATAMCLSSEIHVPGYWTAEIANLIRTAARRGRIEPSALPDVLDAAASLGSVARRHQETSIDRLVRTAEELSLSAYDASYLLLAERLGMPLLTFDRRLRSAAEVRGLELLYP